MHSWDTPFSARPISLAGTGETSTIKRRIPCECGARMSARQAGSITTGAHAGNRPGNGARRARCARPASPARSGECRGLSATPPACGCSRAAGRRARRRKVTRRSGWTSGERTGCAGSSSAAAQVNSSRRTSAFLSRRKHIAVRRAGRAAAHTFISASTSRGGSSA